MQVTSKVYDDGIVAVAMVEPADTVVPSRALRWLPPEPYRKDGKIIETTNLMGGETDWFVLPHTLAVGVAKQLIELKVTEMPCFDDEGFALMVKWLVDLEELNDAMCY